MPSPSSFYDLLEGAKPFTLIFPALEIAGPYWAEDGELTRQPSDELAEEGIEAVQIGPNQYRLACRSDGPFSGLRLHWGDEFIATQRTDGALLLLRVVTPRPYEHFRFLTPRDFDNDAPAAVLVHEMGGGWESVAGGMLTLTVPAARAAELSTALRLTPAPMPRQAEASPGWRIMHAKLQRYPRN